MRRTAGLLSVLAASGVGYGEGFAADAHRSAPTGFLTAMTLAPLEKLGAIDSHKCVTC